MRLKSDPRKKISRRGPKRIPFLRRIFPPPFALSTFPPIQRRRCPIYSHLLVGGTWQGALFRFPPPFSLPPSPFEPGNKIGGRLLLLLRHPISFSPRFATLPFLRRGRGGPIFHPLLLREGLGAEMGGQTRRREKEGKRLKVQEKRERAAGCIRVRRRRREVPPLLRKGGNETEEEDNNNTIPPPSAVTPIFFRGGTTNQSKDV